MVELLSDLNRAHRFIESDMALKNGKVENDFFLNEGEEKKINSVCGQPHTNCIKWR